MILFPLDVFEPKSPDAHFAAEARAVTDSGGAHSLIDHDALVGGNAAESLRRVPPGEGGLTYRGWMVTPEAYSALESAVGTKGYTLRTSAEAFRRCHHLPAWYSAMEGLTAETRWTESDDWAATAEVLASFGDSPVVIKDYSKSEKHYWNEAMFIPNAADLDSAKRVVDRFRELRGQAFDGGYVVRAFENFAPGEARTWWVDGHCALITPHPDEPDRAPEAIDTAWLQDSAAALASPFLAIDLARLDGSGEWRVVEVGDGQVSDRPSSVDAELFVRACLTDR